MIMLGLAWLAVSVVGFSLALPAAKKPRPADWSRTERVGIAMMAVAATAAAIALIFDKPGHG